MTIWPAFQLHHRVQPYFNSNTMVSPIPQLHTSLFGHSGLRRDSSVPRHSGFHNSSTPCPGTQEPCPRPGHRKWSLPVFTPIKWTELGPKLWKKTNTQTGIGILQFQSLCKLLNIVLQGMLGCKHVLVFFKIPKNRVLHLRWLKQGMKP